MAPSAERPYEAEGCDQRPSARDWRAEAQALRAHARRDLAALQRARCGAAGVDPSADDGAHADRAEFAPEYDAVSEPACTSADRSEVGDAAGDASAQTFVLDDDDDCVEAPNDEPCAPSSASDVVQGQGVEENETQAEEEDAGLRPAIETSCAEDQLGQASLPPTLPKGSSQALLSLLARAGHYGHSSSEAGQGLGAMAADRLDDDERRWLATLWALLDMDDAAAVALGTAQSEGEPARSHEGAAASESRDSSTDDRKARM